MKAILKFNLPEDLHEYQMANKAVDMHSTLYEMDQWLRSRIKYADDTTSDDTYKTYEECRAQLHQFLNENNVDLL